ncbi:MAG: hypothetical protein ACPG4W_01805, partial [Flavobacteriales bacterium]
EYLPVTQGVAGSSPVQTAQKATLFLKSGFFFEIPQKQPEFWLFLRYFGFWEAYSNPQISACEI